MPNKRVDDLKNKTDREAGQQWQSALGLENLATREWNEAAYQGARGASDEEIRQSILDSRNRKFF